MLPILSAPAGRTQRPSLKAGGDFLKDDTYLRSQPVRGAIIVNDEIRSRPLYLQSCLPFFPSPQLFFRPLAGSIHPLQSLCLARLNENNRVT
jgi:hypothetical protein